MTQSLNRTAPVVPFTETFVWQEFMNYLADKYINGHLLPDFSSDPPNTGGQYRMYFNTTLNKPRYYNGTVWVTI